MSGTEASHVAGAGGDAFILRYARNGLRKGRICSYLTWKERPIEPLLMMYPHPAPAGSRQFAIQQSRIEKYVTAEGAPTPTLAARALEIAKMFALDTTEMTVNAIMDIIIEQAGDLRAMKQYPPDVAEMLAKTLPAGKKPS